MTQGERAEAGAVAVRRTAWAKVNLYLHVTGRRPDGYHELDSLIVFAAVGDELLFEPAADLTLALTGALLDTGSRNLEQMSQAKTPQDVLNNQAKLMQDCGQQWLSTCRSTVEILTEARDTAAELVEENVKVASEKVKEATRKAA